MSSETSEIPTESTVTELPESVIVQTTPPAVTDVVPPAETVIVAEVVNKLIDAVGLHGISISPDIAADLIAATDKAARWAWHGLVLEAHKIEELFAKL